VLIVCSQTGTVLEAEHCALLDPDELTPEARDEWEEAYCNDTHLASFAALYGVPVMRVYEQRYEQEHLAGSYKTLADETRKELANRHLRSGDLTWGNCIPFSPLALRELLTNIVEETEHLDNETYMALYFGAEFANDEWLTLVGETALSGDEAWITYKSSVVEAVRHVYVNTIRTSGAEPHIKGKGKTS